MEITINYRQPNVERFLEVMAAAKKYDLKFKFYIRNLTTLYSDLLAKLELTDYLTEENKADFFNEYVKPAGSVLFDNRYEKFSEIEKRLSALSKEITFTLDNASKELIKNAYERLELPIERVNKLIHLAGVIAALENEPIAAQHVAEAIQYSFLRDDEV